MRFKLMAIGILILYILPTFLYPMQVHKEEVFKIILNKNNNKIHIDEDRIFTILKVREKLLKARERENKETAQKKIEEQKKDNIEWINIIATAYCNCRICTGNKKNTGIGASGVRVNRGSIALPKEFHFGIKLHIDGLGTYINHDTGSAIKRINKNTIKADIWFPTHNEAKKFGRQMLRGYVIKK